MNRKDFIEALQSQRNRYDAILELAQHTPDIDTPPNYLYTVVEDAAEYARHLMIDFCSKTE